MLSENLEHLFIYSLKKCHAYLIYYNEYMNMTV